MILTTKRLKLRPWREQDAEALYFYARDPEVGPSAGWRPHANAVESLALIRTVLNGPACFAICEAGCDVPIGAAELRLNGHTDMTQRDDECELGYWLGKPFWGRGYMPEAAAALLDYGFSQLHMTTVWCGYYDGNNKSRRVQQKLGFLYHHTCDSVPVPQMQEERVGHTNYMPRSRWQILRQQQTAESVPMTEGLLDSWIALVEQVRDSFPGLDTPEALEEHRQIVAQQLAKGEALCISVEQKVAAALIFSRAHNEICFLAVHPELRQLGLGKKLLQAGLAQLDSGRDITVTTFRETDEKGAAALALYRSCGFQPGALTEAFGASCQCWTLKP